MRTRWNGTAVVILTALVVAMACGGSGSTEPAATRLAHGIVAGNNQSTVAGTAQLSGAVVEQMVQNASGTLSLRRIPDTWQDRAVDLLVPRAFAQGTVVNGSPVVGAVVCAVNVDTTYKLTAFVPCTNTDADGKAVFFFTPGTKAGVAKAEIRGTYQSQPAVFDTARATVVAGSAYQMQFGQVPGHAYDFQLGDLKVGSAIDLRARITAVHDRYGNLVTGWAPVWAFSSDSTSPRDPDGRINLPVFKAAMPPGYLSGTGDLAIVPAHARILFIAIGVDTSYNILRAVP